MVDDVGYNAMVEMINEWAKKNAATLGDRYEPSNGDPQQSQQIPPKQLFVIIFYIRLVFLTYGSNYKVFLI